MTPACAIALLCQELQVLACATLAVAGGGCDSHVNGSELDLSQYVWLHIKIHILIMEIRYNLAQLARKA